MKKIYLFAAAAMMSLSASAIEVSDITEMYAIGSALESGWAMDGPRLEKISEGVFEGSTVLLYGELKFNYEKDNWSAWVYSTSPEAPLSMLNYPYGVTLDAPGDYKFDCQLVGTYKLTLNLNNHSLMVSYAPYLYLVGDAAPGGWNLGQAIPMKGNGQTYTGKATLGTGEFKFLASNTDFNSSILADAPNTPMVLDEPMPANLGGEDNKWICTEAGTYNFTIVIGDNSSVTITRDESAFTPTSFSIVGSALTAEPAGVTEGIYKYCGQVNEGSYKISATDGKSTKWVKLTEDRQFEYVDEADAQSFAVSASEAGTYQLVINAINTTFVANPYTPWETLYLTGSFNTWGFDEFTKTGDNEFTWVGDINLDAENTPEEIKFSGVIGFEDSDMMLHPYVANQPLTEAHYCYNGGNDNKWRVTETANYTIVVNTLMQTVAVQTAPSGIETVKTEGNTTVKAANGVISVNSANAADVTVYDMAGRVVAGANGTDVSLKVAAKGVFVVKVADKAFKVCM